MQNAALHKGKQKERNKGYTCIYVHVHVRTCAVHKCILILVILLHNSVSCLDIIQISTQHIRTCTCVHVHTYILYICTCTVRVHVDTERGLMGIIHLRTCTCSYCTDTEKGWDKVKKAEGWTHHAQRDPWIPMCTCMNYNYVYTL